MVRFFLSLAWRVTTASKTKCERRDGYARMGLQDGGKLRCAFRFERFNRFALGVIGAFGVLNSLVRLGMHEFPSCVSGLSGNNGFLCFGLAGNGLDGL